MTNEEIKSVLLGFLACVGPAHGQETYLSAPITTGRRFLEWRLSLGAGLVEGTAEYASGHQSNVVEPNISRVASIAESARLRFGSLVIDPTALPQIRGWRQSDYHSLWEAIIRSYARRIVLVDGWQYSVGCVRELAVALYTTADTFNERLQVIEPSQLYELVQAAIPELVKASVPVTDHRAVLDVLLDHGA